MLALVFLFGLRDRLFSTEDRERGDVPGWVMITVMTAGIVAALIVIAGPKLTDAFTSAISQVTG